MSNNAPHAELLDQLQNEVNRVLEHTGRLFVAASNGSKSSPNAQAARLKQVLPLSINRCHEALDQLEDELQVAKAVMRRGLALCRERAGEPTADQVNAVPSETVPKPNDLPQTGSTVPLEPENLDPSKDVNMQDAARKEPQFQEGAPTSDKPEENARSSANVDQPDQAQNATVDEHRATELLEADGKPSDSALQIETSNRQPEPQAERPDHSDDDNAPDAANTFNTNADLDSLFNDPMSGAGGAEEAPNFDGDANDTNDFDFDAFSANLDHNANDANDNISTLLPGLQDYANTHPESSSSQADFDALFATEAPAGAEGGHGDGAAEHQGSMGHRDSTFDDLMDFADFNANDFAGHAEGQGSGENQDFDFTMS